MCTVQKLFLKKNEHYNSLTGIDKLLKCFRVSGYSGKIGMSHIVSNNVKVIALKADKS